MKRRVEKQVTLVHVEDDDARAACEEIERIIDRYGVSSQDRDSLWRAFACFCTHLLLKNGELPGPDESPRRNGERT